MCSKNTKIFFILLTSILTISSCIKDVDWTDPKDAIPMQFEYIPLQIGNYIVYEVDSSTFSWKDKIFVSHKYQLKELIADTFRDGAGILNYRIEQYTRNDSTQNWKITEVRASKMLKNKYLVSSDNNWFAEIIFPIKTHKSWDLNLYNSKTKKESIYKYIDKPVQIGDINFDSTMKIERFLYINKVDNVREEDIYAKNIGLVYRYIDSLRTSWNPPHDTTDGFKIEIKYKTHNF